MNTTDKKPSAIKFEELAAKIEKLTPENVAKVAAFVATLKNQMKKEHIA